MPYAEASYRWGGNYRSSSLWSGYWGYGYSPCWTNNNYGYSRWGFGSWGFCNWGFDPFCWNVGVLSPYNAFRSNYWNNCYRNCYWSTFSIPNALPSSYWWYPTTSYCPTYLSVPSSVVVEAELDPVDDGYSIVNTARSAAAGGSADASVPAPASTAEILAAQYIELGDFYLKNDRFEAATEAYAKARNHVPNDASIHFVLADAVFATGDYHYAAFLIAEAVRLDPAMVTADVDKRTFYSDKKLFEAQLEQLQNYCTTKPYDAWAQLVMAYNLRFSDRPTRSIAAFRRVLELDKGNPTAATFLADLVPVPSTKPPTQKEVDGKEDAKKKDVSGR
jgi:tetratricopeptide (TPR) repeat protein